MLHNNAMDSSSIQRQQSGSIAAQVLFKEGLPSERGFTFLQIMITLMQLR